MTERGFSYPASPAQLPPDPADDAAVVDLAERKKTGYGLAAHPAAGTDNSPVDRYYATLSTADQSRFDLALFGPNDRKVTVKIPGRGRFRVPSEGCEAESRRRLAGDVILWARMAYTPEAIDIQLSDRSRAAPPYLAALQQWRRCMAVSGHSYVEPEAAYRSLRDELRETGTAAFRERERAVAVADGTCALRARLPTAALTTRRELVASLNDDVRRSLNKLAAHRAAVVARAEEGGGQ
ncbi:hypothetical protein [Streptomyces lavendofoliae]|uniref:hypothetical protein n=1 Tax=Streptomyces lavendofoliae TaxID=67314 RepID=UPI003D8F7DE7